MPAIGEIRRGPELGFKNRYARYMWAPCVECGTARWVCLVYGQLSRHICQNCRDSRARQHGAGHPAWLGGEYVTSGGYVFAYNPFHPHCNSRGYIQRGRLILEAKLGRFLLPSEHCHHINHITTDDRPENLKALPASEHLKLHAALRKEIGK